MTTFAEAIVIVRKTLENDPAYMTAAHQALEPTGLFEHALTIRSYAGLPDTISAIECAIFDNHGSDIKPKGSKGKRYSTMRYGVQVKAWRDKDFHDKLGQPTASLNGFFMDAQQLIEKIDKLTSNKVEKPISDDYAATLRGFAAEMSPDERLAMLLVKPGKGGTGYLEHSFLFTDIASIQSTKGCVDHTVKLMTKNGLIKLAGFRSTDAKDNSLKGKCVLQSRSANHDFSWKSGSALGLEA